MPERLFKVLTKDATPCHGGNGKWNTHGKWMPRIENIALCQRGYHLCRERDVVGWLGPTIWEAAYRGERIDGSDKIVVSQARLIRRLKTWSDRTARLFACDCANRAMRKYGNGDKRSLTAIKVTRAFAQGDCTRQELSAARAAASDAAGAAARDAARAAAWDAEAGWQTTRLFEYLDGKRTLRPRTHRA